MIEVRPWVRPLEKLLVIPFSSYGSINSKYKAFKAEPYMARLARTCCWTPAVLQQEGKPDYDVMEIPSHHHSAPIG